MNEPAFTTLARVALDEEVLCPATDDVAETVETIGYETLTDLGRCFERTCKLTSESAS